MPPSSIYFTILKYVDDGSDAGLAINADIAYTPVMHIVPGSASSAMRIQRKLANVEGYCEVLFDPNNVYGGQWLKDGEIREVIRPIQNADQDDVYKSGLIARWRPTQSSRYRECYHSVLDRSAGKKGQIRLFLGAINNFSASTELANTEFEIEENKNYDMRMIVQGNENDTTVRVDYNKSYDPDDADWEPLLTYRHLSSSSPAPLPSGRWGWHYYNNSSSLRPTSNPAYYDYCRILSLG